MSLKLKEKIASFVDANCENKALILSFISILSGIFLGSCLYNANMDNFSEYISSFFMSINSHIYNSNFSFFRNIILDALKYFGMMFLLGGNFFGKEISFIVTAIKFIGIGVIISFLYQEYGAEGFEYILLVFIPGKILFIFAALFMTKFCSDSSKELRNGLHYTEKVSSFARIYGTKSVITFLIFLVSCLVDFVLRRFPD